MQERNFHTAASAEWVASDGSGSNASPANVRSMNAKPEPAERVIHSLPLFQPRQQIQPNAVTSSMAAVEAYPDLFESLETLQAQRSSPHGAEDLRSIQKQLTISLKHHHSETLKRLPLENVIQAIAHAWYSCRNSTSNR
jgi:hypothetical protein